jgi:hypothetical protein
MKMGKVNISGGDDQNAGGVSEENQNDNQDASQSASKAVDYDTYDKAVKQKKAFQAKLAERESELEQLRREKQEREEAELAKKGEYQKLLEQREVELKSEREKLSAIQSQIAESRKLSAVLERVGGEVKKEYWALLDLDSVAIDPDTGMPDEASALAAAKEFEKRFPEVVRRPNQKTLPAGAPHGAKPLSFEVEIRAAKTQHELDAVLAKYGKA